MIVLKDKSECCGCTACASVCPRDAIEMRPDGMGFLYPEVDRGKCVDCGMCERVCSFNDGYETDGNLRRPETYGARHKDVHEVETSRSGAAFVALSDCVIGAGGVVYGAGYGDGFRVVHKRAATKKERDEFKGSKYVQSDLRGVFREVKGDLKDGKTVLFTGCPCQTAGLRAYIGKELGKGLLLMDIVCAGVPGPYVWRDYVAYVERKRGGKVCRVNFRDKQVYGWEAHHETFELEGGGGRKERMKGRFYRDILFRPCCNVCHFANTRRPSDVTIADFWSWKKADADFGKDGKGVSLVMVNSEKGRRLFEEGRKDLDCFAVRLEDAMQNHLRKPTDANPEREAFEKDYLERGLEHAFGRFGLTGWRLTLRRMMNRWKRMTGKGIGR